MKHLNETDKQNRDRQKALEQGRRHGLDHGNPPAG